ncbi:hypothetical protein L218DRAFT_877158 [Marasmius fiardii PR-910]|nr:hypothetical protein L218DRAFT_877158 [Marasmius fiardii PR-910]
MSPAGAGDRGATVALAWITCPDDADDGLAYGTAQGYLCIWKRTKGQKRFREVACEHLKGGDQGQEISSIAYDTKSNQLAVSHRSEVVHRFAIDPLMRPTKIVTTKKPEHWPGMVAFGQTTALGPELWSFGRDDREIHILDETGKAIKTKTTGSVIGHAAMNLHGDVFAIDDPYEGVALYRISSQDRLKSFKVDAKEQRLRNVAFLGDGGIVMIGSDHGKIYLFDRRSDEPFDVIDVGIEDWVQCLAVSCGRFDVVLWLTIKIGDGDRWRRGSDCRDVRRHCPRDKVASLG